MGNLVPYRGSRRQDKARVGIMGMNELGYQLMGLGPTDFALGVKFLQQLSREASFPFVATNLQSRTRDNWFKPYVILEHQGVKVGVFCLLPDDVFLRFWMRPYLGPDFSLTVQDPQQALVSWIPRLRSKVQVLVLFSWLDPEQTKAVVAKYKQLDVVFSLGRFYQRLNSDYFFPTRPVQCKVYPRGEGVELLSLDLQDTGLELADIDLRVLDKGVPDDRAMAALVDQFFFQASLQRKRAAELKKQREILKMRPEDFMRWEKEQEPVVVK